MAESRPPLGDMPSSEFRREAHHVVDWAADYLERLERLPVTPDVQPGSLVAALPRQCPELGEPFEAVLADVEQLILPAMTHWGHPGFHAWFVSSGSGPGILGELLAATLSPNCMTWQACPAGTELEQVTLEWLRQLIDLPAAFHGAIHEGASGATFHALAAAREAAGLDVRERGLVGRTDLPPLRVYASEQAHSSVEKAVVALGLGRVGLRSVAVDAAQRLRPDALAQAVAQDRAAGVRPVAVVATVGTTATAAIDPVVEIAAVCAREHLWLHVDAAYGGTAAVVPERREVLAGCDRADSLVVNPHKWLFVPLDLSVLYTRHPEMLRRAFALVPEYLRDRWEGQVDNYMDLGLPMGRRFRALKLWCVLRYFGRTGLVERLREHLRLAAELGAWVDGDARFERVGPVSLAMVCFRMRGSPGAAPQDVEALNRRLLDALNATREVFVTHAVIDGRLVLRVVVGGIRTQQRHVARVWELIQRTATALAGPAGAVDSE